jgi:putative PEP-CTERM system histidine kinase
MVPLPWRHELIGFMALGTERTGRPYGLEDFEFLATVAEQAAGTIVTAQLAETLTQSREFEAFHRVTSFVIHDLKNSISSLSLLSQNALKNFDDAEFQRDAIKTVSRNVERMTALLERLKTAPEAGGLRPERADLALVAAEGLDMVGARARGSLVKELGPARPVTVDREALARVTQNLVSNAFDALDGDGIVTVKTYTDGASAVLSVSDTGCGIPEDFLRNALFTPFRSTKKGGWGIGLYQCKAIVEAHRGTIEVTSKEGAGTTFLVRLPLS